jgi:hypothetical protein
MASLIHAIVDGRQRSGELISLEDVLPDFTLRSDCKMLRSAIRRLTLVSGLGCLRSFLTTSRRRSSGVHCTDNGKTSSVRTCSDTRVMRGGWPEDVARLGGNTVRTVRRGADTSVCVVIGSRNPVVGSSTRDAQNPF